ncbi:hypothetical protein AKO1_008485 [Acrasis kona]|uniref:Uncharacterized protein n=1 Tax=Acrasis kona TaxID=1008807 RepID=A0AAW2YLU6_9EUKA
MVVSLVRFKDQVSELKNRNVELAKSLMDEKKRYLTAVGPLEVQIVEYKREIEKLKQEILEISNIRTINEDLNRRIMSMDDTILGLRSTSEMLESERMRLERCVNDREHANELLNKENARLQGEKKYVEKKFKNHENLKNAEIERHRKQLENKDKTIDHLQRHESRTFQVYKHKSMHKPTAPFTFTERRPLLHLDSSLMNSSNVEATRGVDGAASSSFAASATSPSALSSVLNIGQTCTIASGRTTSPQRSSSRPRVINPTITTVAQHDYGYRHHPHYHLSRSMSENSFRMNERSSSHSTIDGYYDHGSDFERHDDLYLEELSTSLSHHYNHDDDDDEEDGETPPQIVITPSTPEEIQGTPNELI